MGTIFLSLQTGSLGSLLLFLSVIRALEVLQVN